MNSKSLTSYNEMRHERGNRESLPLKPLKGANKQKHKNKLKVEGSNVVVVVVVVVVVLHHCG